MRCHENKNYSHDVNLLKILLPNLHYHKIIIRKLQKKFAHSLFPQGRSKIKKHDLVCIKKFFE